MQDRHRRRLADFPFWLLAIALLGVLALWAIVSNQGYAQIFTALSDGIVTTLWVTLVAFALAIMLGLVIALMRTSGRALLVQVATFYTELVRGIPILVFLFYIAFVGAPATIVAANWLAPPRAVPQAPPGCRRGRSRRERRSSRSSAPRWRAR